MPEGKNGELGPVLVKKAYLLRREWAKRTRGRKEGERNSGHAGEEQQIPLSKAFLRGSKGSGGLNSLGKD